MLSSSYQYLLTIFVYNICFMTIRKKIEYSLLIIMYIASLIMHINCVIIYFYRFFTAIIFFFTRYEIFPKFVTTTIILTVSLLRKNFTSSNENFDSDG